ncbi:MAG: hypothetical protein VX730_07785 [Pseudomonadota bacterium]|nr:hypothetical protein [Pseudomonadota bacterium]
MANGARKTQVLLLNAPTKELIRLQTPFGLIQEGICEHYMPGFNAIFTRLMLSSLNKDVDDAFVDTFTADEFRIPKDEVLKLMRGCGSDEAVFALKIARRNGLDLLTDFKAEILTHMAVSRWREAALYVHPLYFWVQLGEVIASDSFEHLTDEQKAKHNHVTVKAVEIAERIFDNPGQAFKLKVQNPHYLVRG